MPAFRGHFSVQGSAVGGLSYKVKKNVPRHILATSAVARDDLHLRASAHHWHVVPFCSTGKFHRTFLLNKKSPAGTPAPTGNFLIFIFPLSLSSSA